jgi:hypothetical protein
MVEEAGAELSSMLTARKLLILETATTAKKARLPNPLYVYCTKMLSLWSSADRTHWPQYPIDSSGRIEKTPSCLQYRKPPTCHFEATRACPSRNFRLARQPAAIAIGSHKPTCGYRSACSNLDYFRVADDPPGTR